MSKINTTFRSVTDGASPSPEAKLTQSGAAAARQAHNLKAGGSSPSSATKLWEATNTNISAKGKHGERREKSSLGKVRAHYK